MTLAPDPTGARRLLPVLPMEGLTHGSRSAATCHWKCDDACAKPVPNTTDNPYFRDVVASVVSRRTVLAGSAAAAFVVSTGATLAGAPAAAANPRAAVGVGTGGTFGFTAIDAVPADVDDMTVPEGWTWAPIMSWGDPVENDAPPADPATITPEAQAKQFGYNCDYLTVMRSNAGNTAVMVVNHEYTNDELMYAGYNASNPTVQQIRTSMFAHGMSVVNLKRRGRKGPWERDARGRQNRRIHIETVFELDGPAAGHDLLKTAEDPTGRRVKGTLNNCAGGDTPWGTVLSGEENSQQYFRAPAAADRTAAESRYGLTSGTGRYWYRADQRFDMQAPGYRNEPNRHFWIVEVDPDDPTSTPVKHTAMGRFKHEGATIRLAPSGHAVAYMGDDEVFDYVYKFVSRNTYRSDRGPAARRHNMRLLSEGNLYVARFTGDGDFEAGFDGTGEWIPLVEDGRSRVPGMSVAEVLVFTRLAADRVGATKMDRPEDVEPNPRTGAVYIACTNNNSRDGRVVRGEVADADAMNPRSPNKDGHVVELLETGNDPRSRTFSWNLILVCGDPADTAIPQYYGGYTGPVSPISAPDNVAFDSHGNLWVSTDGQPGAIGYNDALHLVPVAGPERGRVQQFLAVPTGAETCGPVIDVEDESVYVAVQHPGETGGATYERPRSTFPYDGVFAGPRPGVVQVYRRR